jgi:secondary thiamine-phosphate synthase enzyme
MFKHTILRIEPGKRIIDLTERVQTAVRTLNLRSGLCNVYSRHTTLGLRIYEFEPLLMSDTMRKLEDFAPRYDRYAHDDLDCRDVPFDEPVNGHSHIKSLLVNTSETIPVLDNMLQLGRWQRLLAFELDDPRGREIMISLVGEFV